MPILGSSNSAANQNMIAKIWTNRVQLSDSVENIVEIAEIACYEHFLIFSTMFSKAVRSWCVKMSTYGVKGQGSFFSVELNILDCLFCCQSNA